MSFSCRPRLTTVLAAIAAASIALAAGAALARQALTSARKPRPDLVVRKLDASPATLRPGETLTIRDRVLNRGRDRAGRFTVSFWLSRASGSARIRIGGRKVSSLRRERRSSATTRVRLPGTLPAGSYRLAACADDPARIDESHEENNCATTTAPIRLVPGDRTPPTSSASGPAYTRSAVIPVEYTAGGTGSRLARVELWVRTPGSASFSKARTDTSPAESAHHFDYTAAAGDGAYAFYTRAYDAAGNAEAAPGSPDATTVLDMAAPSSSATAAGLTQSTSIRVDYTADGTGTPLDRVELWVRTPNAGAYSLASTDNAPAASGHFDYTAAVGDGAYRFFTIAYDRAGNAEPAPGGPDSTTTLDTSPPSVTIDQPGDGSTTDLLTMSGQAGTAPGDTQAVTLKIYSGTGTNGALVQTPTTTVSSSWSATADPLDAGTYTVEAAQQDAAGNTGRATHTFTVPTTVLAAGDIAGPPTGVPPEGDGSATAPLIQQRAGTVLALGDDEYENTGETQSSLQDFMGWYDKTWGLFKSRTMPVPGNHEYGSSTSAPGYFSYFGPIAGDSAKGYYSYSLGGWFIVALNSNSDCAAISCDAGSDQELWLRDELGKHTGQCILAYWHHPLYSSSQTSGVSNAQDNAVRPLFKALLDAHADIVLNGHQHNYERFKPMNSTGTADSNGIREFVVGTGGRSHRTFPPDPFPRAPNSEARNDQTFGILDLTLGSGSYSWRFVPEAGGASTEQGTGTCHNVPSGP